MAEELGHRLVAAIDENLGTEAGFRAADAKGNCFDGVFVPTPEAATLSAAPHLGGPAVPAVVRFSNASNLPDTPDSALEVGVIAVKFLLPDVIGGIECSDDRVLAARRDAYSVSIELRLAARQKSSARSGPA